MADFPLPERERVPCSRCGELCWPPSPEMFARDPLKLPPPLCEDCEEADWVEQIDNRAVR